MTNELIIVGTFNGRTEAEIARGKLEVHGIPSFIVSDDSGGFRPAAQLIEGVHVVVRETDFNRAIELLDVSADAAGRRRRRRSQGI